MVYKEKIANFTVGLLGVLAAITCAVYAAYQLGDTTSLFIAKALCLNTPPPCVIKILFGAIDYLIILLIFISIAERGGLIIDAIASLGASIRNKLRPHRR